MSTRAASAAKALRAKQELIRLLTRKQSPSVPPAAGLNSSRSSDHSSRKPSLDGRNDHHSLYSYNDLRSAYLERIHLLHPDKTKHQQLLDDRQEPQHSQQPTDHTGASGDDEISKSSSPPTRSHHDDFVALQEAWKSYEILVKKNMTNTNARTGYDVSGGSSMEGNFVLFGVGCSFSDNEEERALRSEITDQACRGWFSAGQLTQQGQTGGARDDDSSLKLSDDDMFEEVSNPGKTANSTEKSDSKGCTDNSNSNDNRKTNHGVARPKSLIDHMLPRNHRR